MSEWVTDRYIKPVQDRTPSGAPYCWSVEVRILIHEQDSHGLRLFPGGVAMAQFDYVDACWSWIDFSGGPTLEPRAWRYE